MENLNLLAEIIDRCFESGLAKIWNDQFVKGEIAETDPSNVQPEAKPEKVILEFEDIRPYFHILSVGFFVALLAFCCEKYFGRKKRKIENRAINLEVKRRKIQPLPANLKLRKVPIPGIRPKTV